MADKDFKGFKKDEDTYNCYDTTARSSVSSLTSAVGILGSKVSNLESVTLGLENDIDNIEESLGTASTKNSTSVVTQSTDLVESGAVFDALGFENKNLLLITAVSQTINNIAFTVNDDGTISTANTSNADWSTLVLNRFVLPAGQYIVSGCIGGSQPTYRLVVGKQDAELALLYDGEALFEISEDTEIYVQITVRTANVDMNGKKFYPMIRKATVSDPTYVPYHASVEETKCDNSTIAPTENGTTVQKSGGYAVGSHAIRNGAFITWKNAKAQDETINDASDYTSGDVASALNGLIKSDTFGGITDENTGALIISGSIKRKIVFINIIGRLGFPYFRGANVESGVVVVKPNDFTPAKGETVNGTYYYID